MVRPIRLMSMTGFGRAVIETRGRRVVVEVRSVNHRNLDVKVRGRSLPAAAEIEIIRAVRAALVRGSVQVTVEEENGERHEREGEGTPEARTLERVRAAHRALEQLRLELGLGARVDLATAVGFLRLERDRLPEAPAPLSWEALAPAVNEALAALVEARAREGGLLATELAGRTEQLAVIAARLADTTRPLAERAARRLAERLSAALAAVGHAIGATAALDPARLAQEAALLADRLDVSEELARFEAHRSRMAELLKTAEGGQGGIGRTLEFLLQELGRELNTLGSKAQDAEVSALVIAGKAELEKIREQAQNIE
jgi:uncharacterized protein (TIGR00255 family)